MGVHCGLSLFHFHQMQELIGICGILSQGQPPWALCHVSRANLQFLQCGRVQLSCHGGLCLVSSNAQVGGTHQSGMNMNARTRVWHWNKIIIYFIYFTVVLWRIGTCALFSPLYDFNGSASRSADKHFPSSVCTPVNLPVCARVCVCYECVPSVGRCNSQQAERQQQKNRPRAADKSFLQISSDKDNSCLFTFK